MLGATFLCGALALVWALHSQSGFSLGDLIAHAQSSSPRNYMATCEKIAGSISPASQVYYRDLGESRCDIGMTVNSGFLASQDFDSDISHWANSSSQIPVCSVTSVEPGTPSDVGSIVSWTLCRYALIIMLTLSMPTHHSFTR